MAIWSSFIEGGRPPKIPRARAEARPARVRSRMRSRSNSASAANRVNTKRPELVAVLKSCVKHRKAMSRERKSSMVSMSCRVERARRSSFQTTSSSPARMLSSRRKDSLRVKRKMAAWDDGFLASLISQN